MEKVNAWVLLQSTDNFTYFTLHAYECLKKHNTKYPVYCGYTEDVSQASVDLLSRAGIVMFKLDTTELDKASDLLTETFGGTNGKDFRVPTTDEQKWTAKRYRYSTYKLAILLERKRFNKIVFVDSDIEFQTNVDELMEMPHMSAILEGSPSPWSIEANLKNLSTCCAFNGGLWTWDFSKHASDGERMVRAVKYLPKRKYAWNGMHAWNDQIVLNRFNPTWKDHKELRIDYKYAAMTWFEGWRIILENNIRQQLKGIHFALSTKSMVPFTTIPVPQDIWELDCLYTDEAVNYYRRINETVTKYNNILGTNLELIKIENAFKKYFSEKKEN